MLINEVNVKNYRSILDESLSCEALTALVGRNGAGKSSFLNAIELFYDPLAKVSAEDFYASDVSREIEVSITFSDLTEQEESFFSPYIDQGVLTIARVFTEGVKNTGTYHGTRLQNKDFAEIRSVGTKSDIVRKYRELRSNNSQYASLPTATSADKVKDSLEKWESDHPSMCVRMRDDGQFFGFTGVAQGYLGKHTKFIRIPAVRDASEDAIENRGSCVTEIMDLVVRSVLSARKEVTSFKQHTQNRYEEILNPSKLTELNSLEHQLTNTLRQYTPEASVSLNWSNLDEIDIPMPQALVMLSEDGYESSVQRTGHGLQRAFILTMLQHLIAAREEEIDEEGDGSDETKNKTDHSLPNLVLAIEEPELYQHPSRQRHLASVLLKLAQGKVPGVARQTQVIYTTHSPLFVGLDRFDQIRLIKKNSELTELPKTTSVSKADLGRIATQLWNLGGQQGECYTPQTLLPRMQAIMTPWMNEGFFADVIVLVEGESDRAAVLAVANSMDFDLESMNVSVLPSMGKNSMDRPAVVFKDLGIDSYLIWDNDRTSSNPNTEVNRRLLRITGAEEQDFPVGVWNSHACIEGNLETTLRKEITDPVFKDLLNRACSRFGMAREQALKNPTVLRTVIDQANSQGHSSCTLRNIVRSIVRLRSV